MSISPNISTVGRAIVPLARIPTEAGALLRVRVRAAVVRAYAAAMKTQLAEGGLRFPPVILFFDSQHYWLADGCHRVLAALQAGLTEILAEVHPGTQRDALLFALTANGTHGLPRSNADKRKAVALLLADAEWGQWSDREIARRCQVHHKTVNHLRRHASGEVRQMRERKVQRRGTVYDMNVAATARTTATRPATAAAPAIDPLGIPLPEERANVFAALGDFREACELFDRLAVLLDRIAQGPAGDLYRQELVRTFTNGQAGFACPVLRVARSKLLAAEPYCAYCPRCQRAYPGRTHPACPTCGGRGWTTRAAFESCPDSDRQPLLASLAANPQ
jgi:hypothetical protein